MPRTIPIATAIEKNRLSSNTPFLVLLDVEVVDPDTGAVVETLRVAKNDEPVVYRGATYTAANFTLEVKSEAGALAQVQLLFVDYTRDLQARMQAYGGGVGFKVTMTVVNAAALADAPEIQEFFEVTNATASDYSASFTLGAESGLAKIFPRRRQMRDYCAWRYKGAECGYAGGLASCDLTLQGTNGCAAHNNTLRFGGFPGINPRNGNFG